LLYLSVRWMLYSQIYYFLLYFCVGSMFCSKIHEYREEHKKNIIFSVIFLTVRCTSHNHEHREKHQKGNNYSSSLLFSFRLPYLTTFLCCISLFDGCFALICMNTVKNTKKITTFFLLYYFVLLPYLTTFLSSSYLLDRCFAFRFMNTMKNTKKVTTFFASMWFFYSTIFNYFSFLWSISMLDEYFALRFMNTMKNTKKLTTFLLFCNFLFFYHI